MHFEAAKYDTIVRKWLASERRAKPGGFGSARYSLDTADPLETAGFDAV